MRYEEDCYLPSKLQYILLMDTLDLSADRCGYPNTQP